METLLWVCVVAFVLTVILATDRCLALKEVEQDLKDFYWDALSARDACDPSVRVHYEAHVRALKILIQKDFTL
jgi:hypothetical protein